MKLYIYSTIHFVALLIFTAIMTTLFHFNFDSTLVSVALMTACLAYNKKSE